MPFIRKEDLYWGDYVAVNNDEYIIKNGDIVCVHTATREQMVKIINADGGYTKWGFVVKGLEGRRAYEATIGTELEDSCYLILILKDPINPISIKQFIVKYKNRYHSEPLPLP
jgi:hypothetical protein